MTTYSDRSGLTVMEQRALEYMDRKRDELIVRGRLRCDERPPVVYVARRLTEVIAVCGKGTDANAIVRAHREDTGNNQADYAVDIVPFVGYLWRPGKGECDE